MTLTERYGTRDLTYSRWHRPASIRRFLPDEVANRLDMIDLDAVEVCHTCYEPLALIELAKDVGQGFKQTGIMVALAKRAQVPAVLVFYLPNGTGDITQFRARYVWPRGDETLLTPAGYADWLVQLRKEHTCAKAVAA